MSAETATEAAEASYDGRLWIDGERVTSDVTSPLVDPYRGEILAAVHQATNEQVDAAVTAGRRAQAEMAALPTHRRAAILRDVAKLVGERKDELARTISRQTGKALRDARREIDRSTYTLGATASAVEELSVQLPPADAVPGGEGLLTYAVREPLGVIAAVTPFNAPFNLVMHKVAPALGSGNSIVVKPAPAAPLCALQIAEILHEVGVPAGAMGVLPGGADVARALVGHSGVAGVAFTGGIGAGREIASRAAGKRVMLELGGNSANIVHEDADIDWAARALVAGAFSNTGQSCNSVQRVFVHSSVVSALEERLAKDVGQMVYGDPLDLRTEVGTLVNEDAAMRVAAWISEAVEDGAHLVTGGIRAGAGVSPAVLGDVRMDLRIACQEVFGPVMVLIPYTDLRDAIAQANSTEYALQAAIFTSSLVAAVTATRELQAGAVLVNRSTNFRLDNLPFGGVKSSGTTREGARFTVEEMTSIKTIMIDGTLAGSPHPLASSR